MEIRSLYSELYNLKQNERKLLELIWRKQSVARKELADITGLTGASATRLTKKVMDLLLVEESVEKQGRRGSPNKPLTLNFARYYSVGVSFDKHQVTVVLTNLHGEILDKNVQIVDVVSVNALESILKRFIKNSASLAQDDATIIGIGIAIPGYRAVNEQQWAVHWDFPALLKTDIQLELTKRLQIPVTVERDAVASMWAERLQGQAREQDNFFLFYLAQGVGGCAMLAGVPVLGASGNAGGMGILFPYERSRPSARDLHEFLAKQDANCTIQREIPQDLIESWISHVFADFRRAIDIVTRLYDPGLVIIGGDLPQQVIDSMMKKLACYSIKTGYTADIAVPKLSASSFQQSLVMVGAATLPVVSILTGHLHNEITLLD
ncbi:ROK family protein [Rheinheimera gaetbuli]